MSIAEPDIQTAIEDMQAQMRKDEQISTTTKSMIELLILIITLHTDRSWSNSSKFPSSDLNRERESKK